MNTKGNSLTKVIMSEQDPQIRIKNFDEVALGYSVEEAISEANRCLECKHKPCESGCPVNVPIPQFIHKVKEGEFEEAFQIILSENQLPAICGRVCPQEKQCESKCVRAIKGEPVAIGRLERFVADYSIKKLNEKNNDLNKNLNKKLNKKLNIDKNDSRHNGRIAVVGSGPAGLSCAAQAAKLGYDVTIFEALHEPGGVLVYGIPEFRLPKDLVRREVDTLVDLGVKVEKNVVVGKSIDIHDILKDQYDAVFIGSGAGLPKFLDVPGEELNGVYSSNEFLTRVNLMKAYQYPTYGTPIKIGKKVAVVGAGNVAMDCARTAIRLGAKEVSIIYRRGMDEVPARLEEVHHAKEEGIDFKILTNPLEILGANGKVSGIKCQQMMLDKEDASGRRRPVPVEDSAFILDMDTVIIAVGQTPNPIIKDNTKNLEVKHWGGIIVNEETLETSISDVYAGGDVVSGAATVILAMGAGKRAAIAMHNKLSQKGD